MKKTISAFCTLLLSGLLFNSCLTTTSYSTVEDEIKSEKLVINTMFGREDLKVLDTITVSSDFVYYDPELPGYAGDTYCYGNIAVPSKVVVGDDIAVSIGKMPADKKSRGAYLRAKQNADYLLIQEARKIGADTVLEPSYTVEHEVKAKGKRLLKDAYKITVTAVAVQLKKN